MKTGMLCQILLVVILLTIGTILTINTGTVRTGEITSGISEDVKSITEKYLNDKYPSLNDYYEALDDAFAEYCNDNQKVKYSVLFANKSLGVADVYVEYEYKLFNGRIGRKTIRQTIIKDEPYEWYLGSPYSYCRNINKNYFKASDGTFVAEVEGGLAEGSRWRVDENATLLSTVLDNTQDETGNWKFVQYKN